MIIEQDNQALELEEKSFRIYGTKAELKELSTQLLEAARLVEIGWVEINPIESSYAVKKKPQNPKINKWIS